MHFDFHRIPPRRVIINNVSKSLVRTIPHISFVHNIKAVHIGVLNGTIYNDGKQRFGTQFQQQEIGGLDTRNSKITWRCDTRFIFVKNPHDNCYIVRKGSIEKIRLILYYVMNYDKILVINQSVNAIVRWVHSNYNIFRPGNKIDTAG